MNMIRIVIVFLCLALCGYSESSGQERNIRSALHAMETGRILKAKRKIDRATTHRRTAEYPEAWLLRGQVYSTIALDSVRYPGVSSAAFKAVQAFEKTLSLTRENGLLALQARQGQENLYNQIVQQAIAHTDSAHFKEAWQLLDKAQRILPQQTDAFLLEGHLAFARQLYDKAEHNYAYLIQNLAYKGSGLTEILSNLVTIQLLQHTSVDSALHYVQQAQKYLPDSLRFYQQEIVLLMQAGRLSKAVQRLQSEEFPKAIQAALALQLSQHYLENNNTQAALNLLQDIYRLHPENHRILLSLAKTHQHIAASLKTREKAAADPGFITHKRKVRKYLSLARQHLPQEDATARQDIETLTTSLDALEEDQSP